MALSLGIPKGSLQDSTIELLTKAGIHTSVKRRSYYPVCDDPDLDLILMRPQEMPRYVEEGVIDAGITGYDWTVENDSDVVQVSELEYSKVSRTKSKWVLAVPYDSGFKSPEDLRNKRIATELVQTTKRFFSGLDVPVKVEFSWGTTEAKPPRLVDAIVDITETGSSLKANNLRIISTILETTTVFIANKEAWDQPEKRSKIESLELLLEGTLKAENYVGIKCNCREKDLEKIEKILPAMHNPTVSHLTDKGWYAI
ncbi:MAG: ATP phosphoribosyltransferase, partial [Chitinivibrionales bacterium]